MIEFLDDTTCVLLSGASHAFFMFLRNHILQNFWFDPRMRYHGSEHLLWKVYTMPKKLMLRCSEYIFIQDIPSTVNHLKVMGQGNGAFDTFNKTPLPDTLISLEIAKQGFYAGPHLTYLPTMLQTLIISPLTTVLHYNLDHLPPIKQLILSDNRAQNFMTLDHLPSSLTHLVAHGRMDRLDYLPSSLQFLSLKYYSGCLDHLPSTLRYLSVGYQFNNPVDNLPSTLQHLKLGQSFTQYVDNLPSALKSLSLGRSFNSPLDNLPDSLTHLSIAKYSHLSSLIRPQHTPMHYLPASLTYLSISFELLQHNQHLFDNIDLTINVIN